MKRRISVIMAAFLAAAALTACGGKTEETAAPTQAQTAAEESKETEAAESKEPAELKELVVGASPAPHAEILEAARPVLEEKGYSLKIVEYTDYVQPNLALDTGDLDANYFQHFPYLEQFNAERGTKLVSAVLFIMSPLVFTQERQLLWRNWQTEQRLQFPMMQPMKRAHCCFWRHRA